MRAVHVKASKVTKQAGAGQPPSSHVWMANHDLTGSSLALARIILGAGHSAEAHRHPNAEEVIYLIKGRVAVQAGSQTFLLDAADALAIPAGLPHCIENVGTEDAEMTLSYSTGHREHVHESIARQIWTRFINWNWARARRQGSWKGNWSVLP